MWCDNALNSRLRKFALGPFRGNDSVYMSSLTYFICTHANHGVSESIVYLCLRLYFQGHREGTTTS